MPQATVSPKYQIVIPREVREEVPLPSGQVVQILVKNGVITLVPDRPLSSLRGFLAGMETTAFREKADRP